jgi:NAD(P)-dependent dehydrogenase (short-subunit alcohol dehydrogenase family)
MTDKLALITGGSRGLGRAGALHLADRGTDVVVTYRSAADGAAEVVKNIEAKGRRAAALRLDVAEVSSFEGFATEFGSVLKERFERQSFDFLVNNGGHGVHAMIADTTEQQFDGLMNVHLKGVFFLTQKLLPLIADGGRILNISSGLARFTLPGFAAYACMKGAVEVLTRYLAKELGARGISVNTLAPGAIATDFGGGAVRDNPELNQFVGSQTALGRVGQADDIGAAMALLLSDETRWVNAQRIEASGGMFV